MLCQDRVRLLMGLKVLDTTGIDTVMGELGAAVTTPLSEERSQLSLALRLPRGIFLFLGVGHCAFVIVIAHHLITVLCRALPRLVR